MFRDPVLALVLLWTPVEACWVAVRHLESRGGREPDDARDEHFLAFTLGRGWDGVTFSWQASRTKTLFFAFAAPFWQIQTQKGDTNTKTRLSQVYMGQLM